MNRFFASACLVLATVMVHAQGTMNFHQTNGSTVLVNMAEIDSVVHQLEPPPPLMLVYETGGSLLSYPVADIDSITYSPGGAPGTAQVATFPPASVGFSAALCSGMVGEPGDSPLVARGICYGTAQLPDLGASSALATGTTGPFQVQLSGLQLGTTYYARVFATNAQGTSYGNQVSFSTLSNSNLDPNINYGSMTDQNGNTYATVVIGAQEWMAENLRSTTYANGAPIPHVPATWDWSQLNSGAWCNYNNSAGNVATYGRLYNWYAAADPRNVCPLGWHVPTEVDWSVLMNYLGGVNNAGGKMKAVSPLWATPNTGATNESGFTGLPGGARNSGETFYDLGSLGMWWSASENNEVNAWYRGLQIYTAGLGRNLALKGFGLSVRCVRD